MSDSVTEMLLRAAREVGWNVPPVATVAEFEAASLTLLDHVKGGQDHGHARNGVTTAIRADLSFRERYFSKLRAALSEVDLSTSFERGRNLKPEEAVSLCLEKNGGDKKNGRLQI